MSRPIHILIVDDSPEDCVSYRRQLEREGRHEFKFLIAHSAAEGLKQCKVQAPDCVLLDFSLPDDDGLTLLSRLREEYGENGPPVVMLTGQGSEAIAVQAMKLGAQDYLVKGQLGNGLWRSVQNAIRHVVLDRQVKEQQRQVARLSSERAELVDELERRAAALSDADQRKNEFLAILAHELRNPLGPIRSAAYLIGLNTPSLAPEFEQACDIIERQVAHMTRLIDDLLDVSRIVRGKVVLRNELVNYNLLVRTVVEDHRGEFDEAGQTVSLDLPAEEIWVTGDPTRLSQVLGNILDNARKFTPPGGVIDVSLSVDSAEGTAALKISDSGEGLDSATLERMFDVFSQADRSLARSRGGLGLGLAIVKGITELHGGKVAATSEGPGRGCQVQVTLPQASSPVRAPTLTPTRADEFTPLRILIVEDNQDAAFALRLLLQKLGHQVAVAYTGQAGLETARAFHPELVICDIGLSQDMSGYDVAKAFRADPAIAPAFLVALTGYGQPEDVACASDAGFDLHLTKPIGVNKLMELPARVKQRPPFGATRAGLDAPPC